jgi:hypothetical protein
MTATYEEWRRHRGCTRKKRFDHQLEANAAALRSWRHGYRATPYPCEFCRGWHLTSKPAA